MGITKTPPCYYDPGAPVTMQVADLRRQLEECPYPEVACEINRQLQERLELLEIQRRHQISITLPLNQPSEQIAANIAAVLRTKMTKTAEEVNREVNGLRLRHPHLTALEDFRPEMIKFMEDMAALQLKKAHDYASDEDTYDNFRVMEDAGRPAWEFAFGRIAEKVHRGKQYVKKGAFQVTDEDWRELMLDIANIAGLSAILYQQEREKEPPSDHD